MSVPSRSLARPLVTCRRIIPLLNWRVNKWRQWQGVRRGTRTLGTWTQKEKQPWDGWEALKVRGELWIHGDDGNKAGAPLTPTVHPLRAPGMEPLLHAQPTSTTQVSAHATQQLSGQSSIEIAPGVKTNLQSN